jgi:tetratricopeptide (TPR) repeat protein
MRRLYTNSLGVGELALLAIVLLASSCESFLDVQPRESISDQSTIVDKISAETALNGVYSALGSGSYYGTTFQSIGYLSGDNVQWTGSQSQVQEFINHRVSPENSTIAGAWVAIYNTINRANNVIAKVPQVTDPALTANIKNSIVGQALAIRGLAYFDLARTFGGVPIVLNPTISPLDNRGIGRATQQQTFEQALADFNAAEQLLPEITDRYRVTKNTVWALKSRCHLYQKEYQLAEEMATRLISNPDFGLLTSYGAFFQNDARGTKESVFEIFYNGTTEVNNHRNQWQPQSNGGTRQWAPNTQIASLLSTPATGGNREVLIKVDTQDRIYGDLYYRQPGSDPSYIFRVAEAYLIRAEARARQGNLTGGYEDLNAIRSRSGLIPLESSTPESLLLSIEDERRLEFAFEADRWFDLVRSGRAEEVLGITEDFRMLMPIPVDHLMADKSLEQNPGY